MQENENERHPLGWLSMLITVVVLAISIWHGLCSLFVLFMASYTKNPLFLLLLVAAMTPLIILVRRVREVEWSTRDAVFTALAVIPGFGFTLWVGRETELLGQAVIIASLLAYAIAFAGSVLLARRRAFH